MEDLKSRYEISSSIEQKIPQIIEAFVDFYGEDARKEIEQKFNNVVCLGYLNADSYSLLGNKVRDLASDEAIEMFLQAIGLTNDEKTRRKYFSYGDFGSYADRYKEFYDNYGREDKSAKETIKRIIETLFDVTDIEIDSEEYQRYVQIILSNKVHYEEAKKKYDEIMLDYQSYLKYEEAVEKVKDRLSENYKNKYYREVKPYLTEMDLEDLDDDGLRLLEAFTTENEELLNNDEVSESAREEIKEKRIKYFKINGLDLGDDYNSYVTCGYLEAYLPDRKIVDKIIAIKRKNKEEYSQELLYSLPHLDKLREKVKYLGNALTFFDTNAFNHITGIVPNFRMIDGEVVTVPLLYVDGDTSEEVLDPRLIHEFNHIYELNIDVHDNMLSFCTGWHEGEIPIVQNEESNLEDDDTPDEYELLNEIINELLGQDITKQMHGNGIYLFGDEKTSSNTSHTEYQIVTRLVSVFYNEYRDVIIASRKNHDMNILFNKVGKENFIELNKLINDYMIYFSNHSLYNTIDAIRAGESTEDTEFYFKADKQALEILEKMKNYKIEDGFRL